MQAPVAEIAQKAIVHGLWLKDFFVFLAAAGLVVPLFHRARMGAVLGFLLVGVLLGPFGLGRLADDYAWIRYFTIEDRARVEPFAELGVMFLLFLVGMELSFARLWSLRRFVLGVGGTQVVLSTLVIAAVIAVLGGGAALAVLLGLSLALSSTAIVMQLLEEQGRTATPLGRIALSVLLFQDLMVVPLLFVIGVLGHDRGSLAGGLSLAFAQAAAAVALIAVAGRFLLRPLFRFAAKTGSRELIMAITVLIVVGLAAVTGFAGLSVALGAFLAGLLLGETEYRHQVETDLEPFKGLLLGLFFVTVGMTIDVAAIWRNAPAIVVTVASLLILKGIIVFLAARLFGVAFGVAAELAILLSQAGEFAFVAITLGGASNLIAPPLAQFATAVVGLTMLLTPFAARLARRAGRALADLDHGAHMPDTGAAELSGHVVIGGYGRVGQTIARLLDAQKVPYIALDADAVLVSEHRKAGHGVYFGDAGRAALLRRAGAAQARAFVVTVNAPFAAERMVAAARRQQPKALIYARAKDTAHAARLIRLGAVGTVPEAVETSLQLGARLLEGLGLPDEVVDHSIERMRAQALEALSEKKKD